MKLTIAQKGLQRIAASNKQADSQEIWNLVDVLRAELGDDAFIEYLVIASDPGDLRYTLLDIAEDHGLAGDTRG